MRSHAKSTTTRYPTTCEWLSSRPGRAGVVAEGSGGGDGTFRLARPTLEWRAGINDDSNIDPQATKDFRIKEFEALRKEIDDRRKDQWTTERDVPLATIAIFWALTTIQDKDIPPDLLGVLPLLWFSPLIVWATGMSRWLDDVNLVNEIASFIKQREKYLDPTHLGWEHFHQAKKNMSVTYSLRLISWISVFVIDVVVAVYVLLKSRGII